MEATTEESYLHKDVLVLHNDGADVNVIEVWINYHLSRVRFSHSVVAVFALRSPKQHKHT